MTIRLKESWIPHICSRIPLDQWHRLTDVNLLVPHWHIVSDDDLPHVSGIYKYRNLREFNADLEFLLRNYVPVSLQDVLRHLDGTDKLPDRCFLPTFDDGFREVYDVIGPILHAKGVSAAFFLMTSAIDNHELCYPQKKSLLLCALKSRSDPNLEKEAARLLTCAGIEGKDLGSRIMSIHYHKRHVLDELAPILQCNFKEYVDSSRPYLTSQQVTELMNMGFEFGAHSVDHPFYPELSLDEQLRQTEQSISWMSRHFSYNCQAFAFPYQDAGMSSDFFDGAFNGGVLKVSFGIGGLRQRHHRKNLPRISMERTDLPAAQIVARQFGRAFFRRD